MNHLHTYIYSLSFNQEQEMDTSPPRLIVGYALNAKKLRKSESISSNNGPWNGGGLADILEYTSE